MKSPPPAARRAPTLLARRVAILLAAAALALVSAGEAAAADRSLPWPSVARVADAAETIPDTEVFSLRAATAASPGYWGGLQTTSTGETVNVFASETYTPQDPARTQAWADYLATLLHGPELTSLSLYVAPLDEVQEVCGRGALACYSAQQRSIVAPGDAPAPDLSAEAVVAHEYGHHVAASRSNAPWQAVDWGTKRWATYTQICSRTRSGELDPGDEGDNYDLNPGEGFAEAYRVLNQTRLGVPVSPWTIVSPTFQPDAQALALLTRDVEQPWTAAATSTVTGRVTAKSPRRGKTISTPLDGTVRVTLRVPAKSRFTIQLVDPASGTVLARGTASAPYAATVQTTACGQRSLLARVTAVKGAGTFRLAVSRP